MSETVSREPYGELVEHVIGGGWGSDDPGDGLQRVRVIRGTDFANVRNLQFAEVPTRYESASKIPQRTLRDGDVVLEISGGSRSANQSTGRTLFISDSVLAEFADAVIPASFCRLVRFNRRKVDPLYAYYGLQDMYNAGRAAEYEHQSTGLSNFQFKHFLETERLRLPPLPEQRAIAGVLGSLDDKIEQNRRTAAKLEALARATFRAWFVDFAPVHAKAAGQTAYPGLPPAAFAALPTTFTDSRVGPIPRGWEAGRFGDLIDIHDSKRVPLSKKQREERRGTFRYYGAAGIVDYVNDFLFDGTYVLTGEDGTVTNDDGTPVTQYVWGKFWVNNHAHVLTAKPPFTNEHLLLLLRDLHVKPFVTGAVQPKLSQGNMKSIPVVKPPPSLATAFGVTLDPLYALVRSLADESRHLAALRDYLLPRLLAGAVRVRPVATRGEASCSST